MKINVVVRVDRALKNGTYRISFRFSHKGVNRFEPTDYYSKTKSIRDRDIKLKLEERAADMEKLFNERSMLQEYDMDKIVEYLMNHKLVADFNDNMVDYLFRIADEMKIDNRLHQASIRTLAYSLSDYTKGICPFNDLTAEFVRGWYKYLREPRKLVRRQNNGKFVTIEVNPISEETANNYLRWLRASLNKAKLEFNDEENGVIRINANPFKYITISNPRPQWRKDTSIEILKAIFTLADIKTPGQGAKNRANLARDFFELSFLLIGMNSGDIYKLRKEDLKDGMIVYERSKSKDRAGGSIMQVELSDRAKELIEKYRDKDKSSEWLLDIHKRFANQCAFNKSLNKGLEVVTDLVKCADKLTFYAARRSWAMIARKHCHADKYLIADALNHSKATVTDFYITKDWERIFELNRKVIKIVYA